MIQLKGTLTGPSKSQTEGTNVSKAVDQGYAVTSLEHAIGKNNAMKLFIEALHEHNCFAGNIFYLDDWTMAGERNGDVRDLRTTSHLISEHKHPGTLYSVNRDDIICNTLRSQYNANAFNGECIDALNHWSDKKFTGVYLDLCSGSLSYIKKHLDAVLMTSGKQVVIAWTLLGRNYVGDGLVESLFKLFDYLTKKNCQPALSYANFTTTHKSSNGQNVVTQVWVKK